MPDDFDEEYLVQMHEVKTNIFSDSNSFSKTIEQRYNYDKIVQLLNWKEDRKDSKTIIAEHLVEIQVLDFEHSLLKKINSNLYSPTCEIQYAKKFMNLCERVNLDSNCWKNIPMVTYDSDELFTKPLIINYLSATIDDKNYDVKKDLS